MLINIVKRNSIFKHYICSKLEIMEIKHIKVLANVYLKVYIFF